MTLPGTTVTVETTPQASSFPTDVGTWFVAGLSQKGGGPTLIKSLAEFVTEFGDRVTYGILYDALDVFFREGGNKAYVSRVAGPDAVASTAVLYDAAGSTNSDVSLDVTAKSSGDWGDSLNIAVIAPLVTGFRIQVTHDTDTSVNETSGDLTTCADAVEWATNYSDFVDLALGVHSAEAPRVQSTSLADGDDDRSNITDDEWGAALDLFAADLGPGQVSMPGRTASQGRSDLLDHAAGRNRVALLDATDTDTASTIVTEGATLQETDNSRYGSLWAPWAQVPGITSGTVRDVPYSAIQAGIIARNDGNGHTPNEPSAGALGQSQYAIDLKATWTDAERESLNDAGVDVARKILGGIRTYGYRSLANPTSEPGWLNFANVRMVMKIVADALEIGEDYVFAQLDGQGHKTSEFGGRLIGMLRPYWTAGSLYGNTADEAFQVEVGPSVNTPETLAANELHAVVNLRVSPMAETIQIRIIKTGITEAL